MHCHQTRWSYYHLNFHQFWQIPKKITLWGETKSDKIVTWIFTKYGDHTITLIITSSGRSPYHHNGWNKKWQNRHKNCHQIWWHFRHLNSHHFRQFPKKITILGETMSDKIVTQSVTKFGDNLVTSILTNLCNSPKFSPGWVTIRPKIR